MADFELARQTVIAAEPSRIRALIDDFHQWKTWSPWEDLDPDLERVYSGADRGLGAKYDWKGNRKAGQGSMEITSVTSDTVGIRLEFEKPWKASNQASFELRPVDGGTEVTWRMTGQRTRMMTMLGKLMDKLIGKDFEKGLARLKAAAES
ncbi:SRPBCC family protein [Nocardia sp. CC227C]|uniref:SRPBCC family protein n=1 Tax=Nocardia sp. CC227C TaxID=3044562 RepID=UPI00278C85DA|nr:SRPBCC family protein [Nocardia sp. CC227C]